MKYPITILILLLSSLWTQAQTVYSEIAWKYANEGNYEKAIELEKEGLELLINIKGKNNVEYFISLENIAYLNSRIYNYNEAILYQEEAINLFENNTLVNYVDKNHIYNSYRFLAQYYNELGDYENAIKYCEKSLNIAEEIYGINNIFYAISLADLAQYKNNEGLNDEAILLGSKSLNVIEQISGKSNENYATALNRIAGYYKDKGNYATAIELGTEVLNIRADILGQDHNEYAGALHNLAIYYNALGYYPTAIQMVQRAISIIEKNLGKYNPKYAMYISSLASFYEVIGNYNKSIELITEAYVINNNIFGSNHPLTIRNMLNLAISYRDLGYIDQSLNLLLEIKDLILTKYNDKHPDYAACLDALAICYKAIGDVNEAIKLELDALEIYEYAFGKESPAYAGALDNLGQCFGELGIYEQAIQISDEALTIREKVLGKDHVDYANTLHNLAAYYSKIGDPKRSLEYLTKALTKREKSYGKESSKYSESLSNLAVLQYELGNFNEAIRLGEEVLNLNKTIWGEDHFMYAISLSNLGMFYSSNNDFINSIELQSKGLSIIERRYGKNCGAFNSILFNLIADYNSINDMEKLEKAIKYGINNMLYNIKTNFLYLPSSDKLLFFKTKNDYLNELKYLSFIHEKINIESYMYNVSILTKCILLNSEIEFGKFLADTGDEDLLEKYNEIKSLRLQLNKLYEKPIAERNIDTDSLERHANELERKLMQESAEFGDYTRNLAITWEDVRDNLKDKDAAIEFVHFRLNNDSTMYMAYMLRSGVEAPELVKLFEEKELKNLVDEDDKAGIYTNKAASELVWGKLQSSLEGVENIYFAPDGILHQIAIEYLPNCDGEGMISDRYNLHRLSSTREIAINRHNAPTRDAVLYGGIKYDTDVKTMETESRKYEKPQNRGFNPYYNLTDSLSLRGSLDYLAGSLTEAENINDMMKENNYNITLLTDTIATEESFKNLSGKANGIIHISTHGFYWTESEAERKASHNDRLMFMSQMGENSRRNVEDKALTRTGLFMAGATNALKGDTIPEGVDDGILTAQEIANLDLRVLDLVVLSACQTGMGDISGDGVFGLQRGFKKAGANTILMSLWDVNDDATQILMTNFYKNYLDGMSKQQALQHAQKTVRETPGFSDPKYWAAFILLDALN